MRCRQPTLHLTLQFEALEERFVLSADPVSGADLAYEAWRNQTFSLEDIAIVDSTPLTSGDVTASDAQANNLIGLNTLFQQYGFRGNGYTVAVIDTGVDYTHSALGGGWGNRVIAGYDFVNNDSDPMDDNGHGTHVAGIIGSNNSTYFGVAPDINIVALKVLGANGSGSFGAVEDALRWVINHQSQYNIVAVNMSLGAGNYASNPFSFLEDEFQTLVGQNVFLAAASGNSFYSYNSQPGLGFPSISSNVVSVGAVWEGNYGSVTWSSGARDYSTAADRITSFTQRNSSLDILAPGALIVSTYVGGGYASLAGTSMASPYVAAAAAILHQVYDYVSMGSSATQSNILQIMKNTGATVVDGDDENDNVVNTGLSFRRLDLYSAVNFVVSTADPAPVPQNATLPYSDDFAGSNSTYLGATWEERAGDFTRSNGSAVAATTQSSMTTLRGVSIADVTLTATVTARGSDGGIQLVARQSGSGEGTYYSGGLVNRGGVISAEIFRTISGQTTILTSYQLNRSAGELRFEVAGNSLILYFDNEIVGVATDNQITAAGRVGLRGRIGSADAFQAVVWDSVPTPQNATLPFADSFAGADSTYLGGNWEERSGDFTKSNGMAIAANNQSSMAALRGISIVDVVLTANVVAGGNDGGIHLFARQSGGGEGSYYSGGLVNRGGTIFAEIFRRLDGHNTVLSSVQLGSNSGTLRFEVVGSNLTLALNGQVVGTATDNAISNAGRIGIRGRIGAADSFAAEAVSSVPQNATLPFSDTFAGANSSAAGASWQDVTGAFSKLDGYAVASSTQASMSVLRGISVADVILTGDAQARGNDGGIQLVARQAGSTYYSGGLVNRGGIIYAEIFRCINGTTTILTSTMVGSATGTLRFEVTGTSLRLYFNNQLVGNANDGMITAAGGIGMRGRIGALDSFAATTPSIQSMADAIDDYFSSQA